MCTVLFSEYDQRLDLSRIVLFCTKHNLSPSVKAGGYGTAGWAIGGDIIIDLSKLVEVDIEPPKEDGTFTSLSDVASVNSKGKKPQQNASASGAKRRREDDANLRIYDSASQAVASFLRGPPFSNPQLDGPSPNVRRRLQGPESSTISIPPVRPGFSASSGSSASDLGVSESFVSHEQSVLTPAAVPPAPPPTESTGVSHSLSAGTPIFNPANGLANADPFGYLDTKNFPPPPPPNVTQSSYNSGPMVSSWGPGLDSTFANGPLNFGQIQLPAQAEPIYPHAYVTFGAGMRQKEIDTFTAKQKLEARYITGTGDGIPYHVPL